MAGSVEGAGFWLPPEFLTDDDFLMDKENFAKTGKPNSPDFCFPPEFPYDFPTQDVERLEKLLAMPASPQQTAPFPGSRRGWAGAGNGSPNGVLSPATSPLAAQYDAVGDLIYRAAGQVAKLKLADGFVPEQKDYFAPPRSRFQFHLNWQNINSSVLMSLHKQQNDNGGMWNYGHRGMVQAARDRAVLWDRSGGGGGAAVKRASAGTGVFLPRRYGRDGDIKKPHSPDARKKPGCSPALFPVTPSHAHIKKFDKVDVFPQARSVPQPNVVFTGEYDILMAQRHAALLQPQRSLITSLMEEPAMACFPHEWTY